MKQIAIVGVSCVFPDAANPDKFWQNLINQKDSKTKATKNEMGLNPDFYLGKKKDKDKFYCDYGSYVKDFKFDYNLFSGFEDELKQLDRLFKIPLFVAHEALNDAGEKDVQECGLVLGNLSFPNRSSNQIFLPLYQKIINKGLAPYNKQIPHYIDEKKDVGYENAYSSSYPAQIIQKILKLGKISFALDAACASSLYAISLAADLLRFNEAKMILAGGASFADPFFINMGFSIFQAYPENKKSYPLDKNSEGLIAGEGTAFFLLKRLEDAIKDKNKIYAVIQNVGLSNDGKGTGVLSPNPKGQKIAFKRAYKNLPIKKDDIQYIECHATGTPLGDKVEIESIKNFFTNAADIKLGSVKSNLGHLLAAAGGASLMKVLLCMEKNLIPPSINIKTKVLPKVITKKTKWTDSVKYAAISNFGFGGCNAHLLLEKNDKYKVYENKFQKKDIGIKAAETIIGKISDIKEFEDVLINDEKAFANPPNLRWCGLEKDYELLKELNISNIKHNFLEKFTIDFARFKLPSNKSDMLINQQLLMMKCADRALKNANVKEQAKIAVIILMEADLSLHRYRGRVNLDWQLNEAGIKDSKICDAIKDSFFTNASANRYTSFIGNIMAARISSVWDFSGPSFSLSAGEDSFFKAIKIAKILIQTKQADGVLLGAVDISGSFEKVFLSNQIKDRRKKAEGAACLFLEEEKDDEKYLGIFKDEISNKIDYVENANPHDEAEKSCAFNVGYFDVGSGLLSAICACVLLKKEKEYQNILIKGRYDDRSYDLVCSKAKKPKDIESTDDNQGTFLKTVYMEDEDIIFNLRQNLKKYFKEEVEETERGDTKIISENLIKNSILLAQNHNLFIQSRSLAQKKHLLLIKENTTDFAKTDIICDRCDLEESAKLKNEDLFDKAYEITDSDKEKNVGFSEKNIVWDRCDLEEFAKGKIANVFGKDYEIIDTYKRRVRLPLKDYLFVSRVTKLDAFKNQFIPSSITTEYDIPHDAPYLIDKQIPWAVAVEAGQCDLLLISYMGIDFQCKGERVYRLLDCTLTFTDKIAMAEDTLRYEIKINAFSRSANAFLFFFSYDCFVKDKLVLKMQDGCAGFFSDKELEDGEGIIFSQKELDERKKIKKKNFTPLLKCSKKSFKKEELQYLIYGQTEKCFGLNYKSLHNLSLKFSSQKMLMIDEVLSIDTKDGAYGLGRIVARKKLDKDDWYFPSHFKDDQVLAGSLMAEGCSQLLLFYMLYIGLQTLTDDARFQPIFNLAQKVRCRGQVTPKDTELIYDMEIKEINIDDIPYAVCDVKIILGEKVVVDFQDLGVQILEKDVSEIKQVKEEKKYLYTKKHLEEFALGKLSLCFGDEFKIYDNRSMAPRTPNTYLQVIDNIVQISGERHNFAEEKMMISEYNIQEDAWFIKENLYSNQIPNAILMEIALQPCGFLAVDIGTTLLSKDTDIYFRNLDGVANLRENINLIGKCIQNKIRLLNTFKSKDTFIQKFEFELSVDNQVFYDGKASFGFFPLKLLLKQKGLDDKKPSFCDNLDDFKQVEFKELFKCAEKLDLLDEIYIKADESLIYASKQINKDLWFFACHFHQDPVMPGSIGVESAILALKVFAIKTGLKSKNAKFYLAKAICTWKYRGQIVPSSKFMEIEIKITKIKKDKNKTTILADVNLYCDKIKIYEIFNIGVGIGE